MRSSLSQRTLLAIAASLIFLVVFVLAVFLQQKDEPGQQTAQVESPALLLPALDDADYNWIGSRIYQNEAMGKAEYLTHWNEGEDFPSMGIGHFIWFPRGVDAPFDESFPAMVSYVKQQAGDLAPLPGWLEELEPFDAPWGSKQEFDQARASAEMAQLRNWLERTAQWQARFIVSAFEQRWQDLDLPEERKQQMTGQLQQLVGTARGLFAVIDYYNFKGLGTNPRERYQEQGWGLIQVLEAMPQPVSNGQDPVKLFRVAAAARLSLRVELSPPERNEARWLEGWLKRLDGYLAESSPPGAVTVVDEPVTGCLEIARSRLDGVAV